MLGAAAFLAFYAAWWAFWPIRTVWVDEWKSNATNTPFKITMRRGLSCPQAVWAQEYYEARLKRNPAMLIWTRFPPGQRAMELMSHAIEVQVEKRLGGSATEAEMREARVLQKGYGGVFSHMSVADILRKLWGRSGLAYKWVDKNWNIIEREGKER